MEAKLQEYARLLIEVGLNVQKGQDLVISSPVECAGWRRRWRPRACPRPGPRSDRGRPSPPSWGWACGIDGVVYASMPFVCGGTVVEDFHFAQLGMGMAATHQGKALAIWRR